MNDDMSIFKTHLNKTTMPTLVQTFVPVYQGAWSRHTQSAT